MRVRLRRRLDRLRRSRDEFERGETLLELLMAITILGVCVIAIGSGIAVSVTISGVHRQQATAQDSLHNYAELLQSSYIPCSGTTTPNYAQLLVQLVPPGFQAPTTVVNYWLPDSATFTTQPLCPPGGDSGLQQVTLTLTNNTGKVVESLTVELRSQS